MKWCLSAPATWTATRKAIAHAATLCASTAAANVDGSGGAMFGMTNRPKNNVGIGKGEAETRSQPDAIAQIVRT